MMATGVVHWAPREVNQSYVISPQRTLWIPSLPGSTAQIAGDIRSVMDDESLNALGRFRRLIHVYAQDLARNSHIVRLTYSDENIFHRKELDERNIRLSPHYARIIRQGIEEGVFACEYPEELGELIVILVEHCLKFLCRGEFTANFLSRLIAAERLLEDTLHAQPGSFSMGLCWSFRGGGREEIS